MFDHARSEIGALGMLMDVLTRSSYRESQFGARLFGATVAMRCVKIDLTNPCGSRP